MADFDLIQTDAQVQSILNDGQNMQGAGAQTTLTTESVLLKDVNGNYHKILKSSFTEAIRDTLAGLLVNNDKGTTINQIAAIASGDFGSITPANLASVLGVLKRGRLDNVDFNAVDEGFYTYNDNCTNIPSVVQGYLFVLRTDNMGTSDSTLQIVFDTNSTLFIRRKWVTNTDWNDWESVPLT